MQSRLFPGTPNAVQSGGGALVSALALAFALEIPFQLQKWLFG
jgi:hypothetical protein